MVGMGHVDTWGCVMHPWGVFRGEMCVDLIKLWLDDDLERYLEYFE
jgi:hypothetical protein